MSKNEPYVQQSSCRAPSHSCSCWSLASDEFKYIMFLQLCSHCSQPLMHVAILQKYQYQILSFSHIFNEQLFVNSLAYTSQNHCQTQQKEIVTLSHCRIISANGPEQLLFPTKQHLKWLTLYTRCFAGIIKSHYIKFYGFTEQCIDSPSRFGSCKIQIKDVNLLIEEELFRMIGMEHRITSAYHPQTNGLTER